MNRPSRIVFVDIETGGLDSTRHPIIQIAAIAVDSATLDQIDQFSALIQFSVDDCDAQALEVNCYEPDRWAREAKPSGTVLKGFGDFLRTHATVEQTSKGTGKKYYTAQLAGHNVAGFDALFIREWFRRAGAFMPASFLTLDTLQRALWFFQERPNVSLPENLKIGTLARHFGHPIPGGDLHDALADVRGCIDVYRAIRAENGGSRA